MTLANELQNLYTNTDIALKHCNEILTEKKAGTAATLYEVGDKISLIKADYGELIDGSIAEIEIPYSVRDIRAGAFYGCKNLIDINLVDRYIHTIGDYAFCDCTGLTTFVIHFDTTTIGKGAFKDCVGLKSFDLTTGSGHITRIKAETFSGCVNLETINCTGTYGLHDGIVGIGHIEEAAFKDCKNLVFTNIVCPDISSYAFSGCTSLTNLKVGGSPNCVISSYAFGGCINLEKVITTSDITLCEHSFDGSNLTSLVLTNTRDITTSNNSDISMTDVLINTPIAQGNGYIYVYSSILSDYLSHPQWSAYTSQFRTIEDYPDILNN